ncbi:AAA domain-containing protein [Mycena filopes]|nr:AAA domain-containing protein [Mycena filopes]
MADMDTIASARDRTVWLVAQSNVAVKNIAEKLASVGFWDFKLLVSKGGHEHLYADKLERNLVRPNDYFSVPKIILCTLSMLSNPRISAFTRVVPIETVIVDEASQVEIGNFLPMISLYSTTLRKLVFIGDDKQHRMPTQARASSSAEQVYKGKLKTVHDDTTQCCQFIDVKNSKEEMKGGSWMNEEEIKAVVGEARSCVNKGRSYRIVTPYDAQRGMLEGALKREKDIPWEDKVFCVDSFQGNEDDYIILSIVRTEKIGFLAEPRRVNVMLSRCKKGMRIFTSRGFVEGKAKDSLVGRLAMEIGETAWES